MTIVINKTTLIHKDKISPNWENSTITRQCWHDTKNAIQIPHKLQELEEWECCSLYQHLRQEKSLQTYPVKGTRNTSQWNKI